MAEPDVIYKWTPPFPGAFVKNVPQRDLFEADVNHMTAAERADAFTPHPVYGTPCYTAEHTDGKKLQHTYAQAAKAAAAGLPELDEQNAAIVSPVALAPIPTKATKAGDE